jgi:hypothetical protein
MTKDEALEQDARIEASFARLPTVSQQVLKARGMLRAGTQLSLVEIAQLMQSNISTVVTRLHKARAELVELSGGSLSPPFVGDRAYLYFGHTAWMIVLAADAKVTGFQRLPTFGPAAESAVAAWHATEEPTISRAKIKTFQQNLDALRSPPPTNKPRTVPATIYIESANDLLGYWLNQFITEPEHESCQDLLESQL